MLGVLKRITTRKGGVTIVTEIKDIFYNVNFKVDEMVEVKQASETWYKNGN